MQRGLKPGTLKYLINKELDFFIAILLVGVIYFIRGLSNSTFLYDYNLINTIFITIFSVNFTVFALSKFLLENYPKIRSDEIKKEIDAIFRAPIKASVIGLLLSIIFYFSNFTFLNYFIFIIYFLLFYSILSSYYVFKFIYEISIRRGKS